MDSRKRPAAPRSRGNSPPTKGRRLSEQTSATNRYADTAYSRPPRSPPYSRKNSAASLPASTQTGPAPYSTNERHIDQNSRSRDRDAITGLERPQIGGRQVSSRKQSTGHTPMHAMSPMSNRSGSSTPVQLAPIVPSMLPVAQDALTLQSTPMDSLKALRSHKASLAVGVAQAAGGATTQEVKELKAQVQAAYLRETHLRSELKKFESRIELLEAFPTQLAALGKAFEQQQQAAANGPSPEDLNTRISSLETAKPTIKSAQFEALQSVVHVMKTKAEMPDPVPEELRRLQATVRQVDKKITETASIIDAIKAEVDDLVKDVRTIKEQQMQQPRGLVGRTDFEELSRNLETLQGRLSKVESNEAKTSQTTVTLQTGLTRMNDQLRDFVSSTQNHLESFPPIHESFREVACSLGEEQEKLRKTVQGVKITVAELKDKSQIESTQSLPLRLSEKHNELSDRVTKLEATGKLASPMLLAYHNEQAKFSDLHNRLRYVETSIGGLEKDIGDRPDIQMITVTIGEIMDPFDHRFKQHVQHLTQAQEKLASLQVQVEKSQQEPLVATFSASQLALVQQGTTEIKQDLSRLRASVHTEVDQRTADIEDLKQQLAVKQDITTATQAIDVVKAAVRSLQKQYENISTDALYQKMVHWFLQTHPHPAAKMLQKVDTIEHDLTQLRKFTDAITQIPDSAQTLGTLAQLGSQLKALVQISPRLTALAQSTLATEDPSKAHQQYENLVKMVGSLQTSMQGKFNDLEENQVENLQGPLHQLRSDLDKGLEDLNDPKHKELLGMLPILFLHVGQLQWVLEYLNQKLPEGGLGVKWNFDWKKKYPVSSPFPVSGDTAGKGKSKRQTWL